MKIPTIIQTISLSDINVKDETFRLSPPRVEESLVKSIRDVGLVNPPILQLKNDGRYRIVAGFQRVGILRDQGATTITARLIEKGVSDLQLFKLSLRVQSADHSLSSIEISKAIQKARNLFHITDTDIVSSYLPLMGCGKNPKILDLYAPLSSLEIPIQVAVENAELSVEIAANLTQVSLKDREAFFHLIHTIRLGKNRQREYWRLLTDIASLENRTISAVINDPQIRNIINNEKLSPNQKAEKVKQLLWWRRYPRYSVVERKFNELLKKMKLPPQLVIHHPAFFEGEIFQVNFSFKNSEDFYKKVEQLQNLKKGGLIEEIWKIR